MSGARYTDWSHTRVLGDREAAAQYVPEARKLLGFVMDEAKRNNLGVHQITRELEDGTVIIAEKHGDIPRMTIIPVSMGSTAAVFRSQRSMSMMSCRVIGPPTSSR